MKVVDVRCKACGHVQEDFLPTIGEPEWEPCEKCKCTDMELVEGQIEVSSSGKHPQAGAGPWG